MNEQSIKKLLSQANKAYKKKDKRKGAQLVNEILQEDFMHKGTWELLYQLYGSNKPFEEFQLTFTQQHYPNKLPILEANVQDETSISTASSEVASEGKLDEKRRSSGGHALSGRLSSTDVKSTTNSRSSQRKESTPQKPMTKTTSHSFSMTPVKPIPKKPGDKISVVIVDDITQTRENIVRSLRFQEDIEVIGTASSGSEAIQITRELQPDVILMDVNMPDMDGLTATTYIKRILPFSQVIMLTVQDDVDYIRRAMMAGARDFLSKPPTIDELVTAIQRAGELAFHERQKTTSIDEALASGLYASRGKIITVYSPKGGSGSSMFASNLAAALYDEETSVALIDGNFQFGDVSVFFNAQSRKSTLDLTSHSDELSPELIEEVLFTHSSGIQLLPSPRPEDAEIITEDQFSTLLNYLRGLYPYVIVDTSHNLTDGTVSALKVSDIIVLITTQDIPSIARTRRFLDFSRSIEVDSRKVVLVINQYDKRIGVTDDKVGEALKLEVSAVLPMEKTTVIPSINRGSPFMLQNEMITKPIAKEMLKAIEEIREKITYLEEAKKEAEEETEQ